jgi:uncharacterized membrane protein YhaH (DUF805 family)
MKEFFFWRGKVKNREYFLTILLINIVSGIHGAASYDIANGDALLITLSSCLSIALLYLMVCATIKRLHDIGCTGAFSFICAIPVVNLIFCFFLCFLKSKEESKDADTDASSCEGVGL